MNKYLLICTLVFSSFTSQASNLINDESIKDQKNCFNHIFKDYATWRAFIKDKRQKRIKSEEKLSKGMSVFDSMFGEEKFNQYKNNLSCITFKYNVDGLVISGYVIKPKSNEKKLPVLIYNRGGNGNYGSVVFGSMMHNLFPIANEGFVIIGSQYRLSRTKGVLLDEFGGKDVNDVTALLDYIPSINGADEQRIGMFGASRGGMQTHLAVKKVKNIKAIATIAGATDLIKELDFRPAMENVYAKRIPDYDKNKVAELEKRSVLNWVSELSPNIPILLLHGENDKRVSVKNSIVLAAALSKNNIPHKLVLYPDDNHGLMQNKEKANKELVNWFNKYL
ncbi:MAG: S9 family peptidase [Colwelliaceae bacterium]|nr:S9 family peptidase [Colwelliaceae bacterium]